MSFKTPLVFMLSLSLGFPATAQCLNGLDPLYRQGRESFERGQYLLATMHFSQFSLLACSSGKTAESRVRWAQSLYELGELQEGDLILEKVSEPPEAVSKARIVRAWYQPDSRASLSPSERNRFTEWESDLERVPAVKSPLTAGLLSTALPGAGQAYNGFYQSAAFSFVLNALFLAATTNFHQRRMDGAALTSGVLFSVVYVGNIVGSVKSAQALNGAARNDRARERKPRAFPELFPVP